VRLTCIVLCWSAYAMIAAPATASTVLYTDRDAFVLAADPNHLITFDGSAAVVEINLPLSSYQVTFDDLLRFNFDLVSGVGWFPGDTSVVMGRSGLLSSGSLLEPVYALGFDVFGAAPSGAIGGFGFSTSGFIGIVSDQPFTPGIAYLQNPSPTMGTYAIDNVLVTTVPDEGNTFVVLLFAVCALVIARKVTGSE